jgi:hypothetical protein
VRKLTRGSGSWGRRGGSCEAGLFSREEQREIACIHQVDVFKVTCVRDRCQTQKESKIQRKQLQCVHDGMTSSGLVSSQRNQAIRVVARRVKIKDW